MVEAKLYWSKKCTHCTKLMAYIREYYNDVVKHVELICLDDIDYSQFPKQLRDVPHLQLNVRESVIGPDILPWIVDKIKPIIDNKVRFGDMGINDRPVLNNDSTMGLKMSNSHGFTQISSKKPTPVMQNTSDLPNGTRAVRY